MSTYHSNTMQSKYDGTPVMDNVDEYKMATQHKTAAALTALEENEARMKQDLIMDEHKIVLAELLIRFGLKGDGTAGLSSEIAKARLDNEGANVLTHRDELGEVALFIQALFVGSPITLLLWCGALFCFIAFSIQAGTYDDPPTDNLFLGIVFLIIIFVSSIFVFWQNSRTRRIIRTFQERVELSKPIKCLRDNVWQMVDSSNLVRGDVIELGEGDRVPADVRLTYCSPEFKLDMSNLTGDMEPQVRSPFEIHDNPLETKNLLFINNECISGTCRGVIINTGDQTVYGRVANWPEYMEYQDAPYITEINQFLVISTVVGLILALVWFIMTFQLNYWWYESVVFALGVAFAVMPESLLIVSTVVLALTARRMSRKNCLVKSLDAVETMGSISTVCTQKTGTLTQNSMTVSHYWSDEHITDVQIPGIDNDYTQAPVDRSNTFRDLLFCAQHCNKAFFTDQTSSGDEEASQHRPASGEAADIALLRWAETLEPGVAERRKETLRRVFDLPFNADLRLSAMIYEDVAQRYRRLLVKGAPEAVWDRCTSVATASGAAGVDERYREAFSLALEELGTMGERVMAFADVQDYPPPASGAFKYYYNDDADNNVALAGLRLLGLVAMVDPPRPGVPEAVAKCRRAGIRVVMVTGDNPVTAKAVARAVNIIGEHSETAEDVARRRGVPVEEINRQYLGEDWHLALDPRAGMGAGPLDGMLGVDKFNTNARQDMTTTFHLASDAPKACVLTGAELAKMDGRSLDGILRIFPELVFARVTPAQKLLVVEACQRAGEVVAMTGRRVQDASSIRKADLGIAMGVSGTDVTKRAADVILLDDNFASVITGIEEGRLAFDNLKKSMVYQLASNIPELVPYFIWMMFDTPLFFNTVTVLCVDLATDIYPAISFAYEAAESDLMRRPPRNTYKEHLISQRLLQFSYAQLGMIQSAAAFFTGFVIFAESGFWPHRLKGLRTEWDSPCINDVEDSYGQEWSVGQRGALRAQVVSGVLLSIVFCQIATLIVVRTRRDSMTDNMCVPSRIARNPVMLISIVVELALLAIFVYLPGMQRAVGTAPLRVLWWFPSMPFVLLILLYDELRKFLLRTFERQELSRMGKPKDEVTPEAQNSWLHKETYY